MPVVAERKVPLAWLLLYRQPIRLAVGVLGITISSTLIFLQLGLYSSVLDTAVLFHYRLNGDLYIMSRDSSYLNAMQPFSQIRIGQAYGHPDVMAVDPVNIASVPWRQRESKEARSFLGIGIDPEKGTLKLEDAETNGSSLHEKGNVLFDSGSRPELRSTVNAIRGGLAAESEANGFKLKAVGIVRIGATFANDGFIITSRETLKRISAVKDNSIELGVIHLKQGSSTKEAASGLRRILPDDVIVLDKDSYIRREINYWQRNTPTAYVFGLGVIIGFAVGVILVYQIIFADVSDHLAEYATLLAMGYRFTYLLKTVSLEALSLAALGFIPGCLGGLAIYHVVNIASSLNLTLGPARITTVLAFTFGMAAVSSSLVLRKLSKIDPAEIF